MPDEPVRPDAPPPYLDAASIYRWGASVAGFMGAAVAVGALGDRQMPIGRRAGASAVALLTVAWSGRAMKDPAVMGRLVVEHPRQLLLASTAPIALAPFLGNHFALLQTSAVGGIGYAAAALEGPRERRALAAAGSVWWMAVRAARITDWQAELTHRKRVIDWVIYPLSLLAAAEVTPSVVSAARELRILRRDLDLASSDLEDLSQYRTRVTSALDHFERALFQAQDVLAAGDTPHLRAARKLVLRGLSRLGERRGALSVVRGSGVDRLVKTRGSVALRSLGVPEITPHVEVDEQIAIRDPRTLGLIAALLHGAIGNAVRHASPDQLHIALRSDGQERFTLEISNGGPLVDPAPFGAGLKALREQSEHLDGTLDAGPLPGGGWAVTLNCPQGPSSAAGRRETVDEILQIIEQALATGFWINSAMAVAVALDGRQSTDAARTWGRVGTLGVVGTAALLERRGLLKSDGTKVGQESPRPLQAVLWSAAAVSARSEWLDNSIWTGWASLGLGRLGMRGRTRSFAPVAAAHFLAAATSYRGTTRDRPRVLAEQLMTLAVGPVTLLVARAWLRWIDSTERELINQLAEVEGLHDIAEALHTNHPVTGAVTDLQELLPREGAEQARAEFTTAKRALVSARTSLPKRHDALGFAYNLGDAVTQGLYPIPIHLEVEENSLFELGRKATMTADFRRRTSIVGERIADYYRTEYPRDWLLRPTLQSLKLQISGDHITKTVRVRTAPTLRVDRDPAGVQDLAAALADVGGVVQEGFTDGVLRLIIAAPTDWRRTHLRRA